MHRPQSAVRSSGLPGIVHRSSFIVRRCESGSLAHRRHLGFRWMLRILKFWVVLRPFTIRHKFRLCTDFARVAPRGRPYTV